MLYPFEVFVQDHYLVVVKYKYKLSREVFLVALFRFTTHSLTQNRVVK